MPEIVDNRYLIIRLLGSGGMGKVYLAHDETLDRDIAIKILDHQYAEDPEFFERRGFRVVREQTVERRGVELTNFAMEKPLH